MKALVEKDLRTQINWQPHEKQQEILDSPSDEVVIAAGRGFGKTSVCSYEILKALLKGEHVLLIAPTYDLCDRVLEYVEEWMRRGFPPLIRSMSRRPPQTIDFRKLKDSSIPLGRLEARSAESPEGMLGKRFDLVVVDEAARVKREIWHTYIHPSTNKAGSRLIAISTPRGKNYFYELWVRAKDMGGAFQFASNKRPDFREKDWEGPKKRFPSDIFSQEYKAEFLEDASHVFKGVKEIVGKTLSDAKSGHKYVAGVDLGKHHDFTVITVIDIYDNSVAYWDRFNKLSWPFQRKKIKTIAKRYNNARLVIDSNNVGDAMVDELEDEGLFVEPYQLPGGRSQKKKELIEKLQVYIEQKYLTIPEIPVLLDELEAFTYDITPSGRIRYQAPSGLHDDCVLSLAYAVAELHGKANPVSPIKKELARVHQNRKKLNQSYI